MDVDEAALPPVVPLRRQLTAGSTAVLGRARALGQDHETAAEVLQRASDAEVAGHINRTGKLDAQRVLLSRGVAAASSHLDALLGTKHKKAPVAAAALPAPPAVEAPGLSISAAMARSSPKVSPKGLAAAEPPAAPALTAPAAASAGAAEVPKKRKKKNAYASMMAGIMAPMEGDAEKKASELEKTKSALGGGHFSKLDNI
jgi:hypothetical protein